MENKNIVLKKNIILIPADYNGKSNLKGILTLNFKDEKIFGEIRCFNIKQTNENYNIGISIGDKIFKTKAIASELSKLKLNINLNVSDNSKISCVIVNVNKKDYETLLWGSTETTKALQNSILIQNLIDDSEFSKVSRQIESLKAENKTETLSDKQEEIFEDEILENYIDKVVEQTEPNIKKKNNFVESLNDSGNFYERIEGQIDKLFLENEPEKILEQIIPDGKFCKIQNENEFYVFGVISENGKTKCLCYGIPMESYDVPPKDMEGFSQWLPLDVNDYKGKGYWLTYQDAITGENISVEIIS